MKTNDSLATVITATPDERGFRIPPPPGMTAAEYEARSAGFVGDYRPLAVRLAEKYARQS